MRLLVSCGSTGVFTDEGRLPLPPDINCPTNSSLPCVQKFSGETHLGVFTVNFDTFSIAFLGDQITRSLTGDARSFEILQYTASPGLFCP